MNRRRFLALLGSSAFAPIVAKDYMTSEQVNAIDEEYVQLLTSLQKSGIPIPVRMWVAAADVPIHEVINLPIGALVPTPNIGTLTKDMVESFSDFE